MPVIEEVFFARNIRYLRKKKGYSQQQVARLLKLSRQNVYQHWEAGRAYPKDFPMLLKLSDVLGARSIDNLLKKDMAKDDGEQNANANFFSNQVTLNHRQKTKS